MMLVVQVQAWLLRETVAHQKHTTCAQRPAKLQASFLEAAVDYPYHTNTSDQVVIDLGLEVEGSPLVVMVAVLAVQWMALVSENSLKTLRSKSLVASLCSGSP
jgi:hypothetical protein